MSYSKNEIGGKLKAGLMGPLKSSTKHARSLGDGQALEAPPVCADEARWDVEGMQEKTLLQFTGEKKNPLKSSESNKRIRQLVFVKFYGHSV